jgi:uncharacterized protein (TIGR03435 family)
MPMMDEASCPPKLTPEERIALLKAGQPLPNDCGAQRWVIPRNGMMSENDHGLTLDQYASGLTRVLDRAVIDKTGLKGFFDFHVDFSPTKPRRRLCPAGA